MGKELALPEPEPVEFDSQAVLLAEYNECKKAIDYWKDRQESVKKRLVEALGPDHEVGVIGDREVFSYKPKNQLNKGALEKARPDLWAQYQHEVTKFEFDEDLFKYAQPDVWNEFRIKAVKVDWNG